MLDRMPTFDSLWHSRDLKMSLTSNHEAMFEYLNPSLVKAHQGHHPHYTKATFCLFLSFKQMSYA